MPDAVVNANAYPSLLTIALRNAFPAKTLIFSRFVPCKSRACFATRPAICARGNLHRGEGVENTAGARVAPLSKGISMKDGQNNSQSGGQKNSGGSRVQGEGDYESARKYKKDTENFISEHKSDIPGMAKDAEKALDSSEGDALRRAEEEGKAKAKR